ncbi:glycogen debranching N-terminal domain-containing protein [Microbacterium sp. DT81.1]|uniref:glycogen debranching N-terminal domain-containing protein n=1 Tax=Microbacterium sp. DT81.1 TaxID=3393413 RepID=UPI003CF31FC0
MSDAPLAPRALQPLLNDAIIALRAPTQVWSGRSGDLGAEPIHGVYHGDVRHIRQITLTVGDAAPEWISVSPDGASRVVFGGLLRALDDGTPDPKVRVLRERVVAAGEVGETYTFHSKVEHEVDITLRARLVPDFALLMDVKAGMPEARDWSPSIPLGAGAPFTVSSGERSFTLLAADADVSLDDGAIVLDWDLRIAPGEGAGASWSLSLVDPTLVVQVASDHSRWVVPARPAPGEDPRIGRWLDAALQDLDALRLALPEHPDDAFYAAGAPWFLTLFGRDSLWAARLALPLDRRIAASTLRVLARLQGDATDADSAEQPGKILHELRAAPLEMPGEGITLPPVYYGTVDATALWVCLLFEAHAAGMPDDEVRELLPALRRALDWLMSADTDGDGFIDYIDETGHGLTNQGWKDSGDSIQWRSGELAQGPIALCEVQGYAYEAALAGAELLDAFGEPGATELWDWAAGLKARFAEAYWVETPEGRYPAIALDAQKRPVDTLTSNIGHLLGTGLLNPDEERQVAALLVGPTMLSGFGVRTMSTDAAGYWPLSYHGGSVWTHDSAIIARGMALAGLHEQAGAVIDGLLAAAEGFGFRMPELHSGDPRSQTSLPTPYPAACRPQAWSAASAVAAAQIARRLPPGAAL